jgi:protein transport protein SEC24
VVVDALLDSLPSLFEKNISIESALGPALKATFMIMVCVISTSS